jgi:serine/threonine protein kinase
MAADALSKLGKYEIRGILGKGAMGIVYDGFDPVIERRVAIKTIAKATMDPVEAAQLLGRFKREAQAAGRLNHASIVSIHDYGEHDRVAFIAMEFIKGKDLRNYLDSEERFDLQRLVRIVCDVLDALDHAHRNGVVHRDIKPANIMITDEGRVKVADFGVARIESSMMTQVGTRIGTPAYMSPEQHQGLAATGRSDLFSVGVILYQFLTGERPFSGEGYALVSQILLRDPIPPSEINFNIPPALDAVTMKALAKHPEDRFATAQEFADAFREAATGEPVRSDAHFVPDERMPARNDREAILLPGSGRAARRAATSSINGASSISEVSLEAELVYWKEITDSTEAADFETFVQVFPDSRFATLARRRMARMKADAQSRHASDERGQQGAALRAGIESNRTGRCAEEEHVRPSDDEGQSPEPEAAPAQDQADGQREIEEIEAHPPVNVVAQRVGENRQDAEPLRHRTEARNRVDMQARNQCDIEQPLRRLDAEEPNLIALPGGEPNERVSAADMPVRVIEQESRKPSRLLIAAVVVAVLTGTGYWCANQPELAQVITAVRMQTYAIVTQLQQRALPHQAQQSEQGRAADEARQVEQQSALDAATPPIEEQPKPDEVARLVQEQLERDEIARAVEEQRREEEALAAERSRRLEAARATGRQNYQLAMALLDQGRTSEAVRLLRQLANNGHGMAAKALGDLYMTGERVLLDRQEASHFYALAERNGVRIDRSAFVRR